MKILQAVVGLALVALLAGCSNSSMIEDSVGVGADDNAVMCVKATVPGRLTGTTVAVKRVEFPAWMRPETLLPAIDPSNVTPEMVELYKAAWQEMASQLDTLEDKFCDG